MRSRIITAVACAALLAMAAPASAQDIVVTLQAFTGRTTVSLTDIATVGAVPISQGECDAGAMLDFRFTMVDSARSQLHLFHGANCEMASVRNDTTDTSCTDLNLEYSIDMNSEVNVSIPVSSLVDCTAGSSGTRTIYVLALDNTTSEVSGAGQKVTFPIAYDFAGPSAPSNLVARDGESAMTLTWDGSTDQITTYEVFFVADGCDAAGTVTTTRLMDPAAPDESAIIATVPAPTAQASVAFPSGVTIGSHNAVAIRGVDSSMNNGDLSAVTCVSRVDLVSFWDAYCSGGDAPAACGSSGCSAAPGRGSGGVLWSVLLLLGLAWRVRR